MNIKSYNKEEKDHYNIYIRFYKICSNISSFYYCYINFNGNIPFISYCNNSTFEKKKRNFNFCIF